MTQDGGWVGSLGRVAAKPVAQLSFNAFTEKSRETK